MMSDETSLLEDMIHERDSHIAALTNQLHQISDSIHTLSKELHQKSIARKQQREEHSQSIKKLKEEHLEQRQKLAKFEQNVKGGGGLRVHEYAALMRSANSSQAQVESSYVIRLQAQLCRAMHSLGVMESQLALVKENCSSLIRFMKEDLSHMVDDRTRREIELMNGLAKVDHEHRVLQEEMEKKINEKEELLESVREEYEELGLVYNEEEVKAALEVKYLLEQMDKVEKEKERVEKELLQALLDREKQIVALKNETKELGIKLETLHRNETEEGGKKSDDVESVQQQQAGQKEEDIRAADDDDDAQSDNNKVQAEEDSTVEKATESKGETEESDDTNDHKEAILSSVTSQLEAATIEEKADSSKQEESAGNGTDSIEKANTDSDPAVVEDEGGTSSSDGGENDDGIVSSENKVEENHHDGGSNNAEEEQEEHISDVSPKTDGLDTMPQNDDETDAEVMTESEEVSPEPLSSSDDIVENETK
jgi:hypothetical protein